MMRILFALSALVISIVFFPLLGHAAADPYEPIDRGEFAKIIAQTLFSEESVNSCDGSTIRFRDVSAKNPFFKYICSVRKAGLIKGFPNGTFQPSKAINLAEASAVLVKAFRIKLPRHSELIYQYRLVSADGSEQLIKEEPKWYKGPLVALGREHAIPPSFFDFNDKVTRAELEEMIHRLKNDLKDEPYREFTSGRDFREGAFKMNVDDARTTPIFRLFGDIAKAYFGKAVFQGGGLGSFSNPSTYLIDDLGYDPDSSLNDECGRFATDSVSVITSGTDWNIELKGRSSGYCHVVAEDVDYEEYCASPLPGFGCRCKTHPDGSEQCSLMTRAPYTLTLKKEGDRFRLEDPKTDRLRIFRVPLEKLPFEFGSDGPLYEQSRVLTKGTLEIKQMPDSRKLFTYRTPWRSVFYDMRGVPFLAFEKNLLGDGMFRKFYEAPEHNMNPYGTGAVNFQRCLENTLPSLKSRVYQFCFKKEGKDFIVASYLELSDRVTFWIDEHFKR